VIEIELKQKIREIADFPKHGIRFYDITTLLSDADAFRESIEQMHAFLKGKKFDKIAAIESRGFIFAAPLALKLGCGLAIIRKPGKLPSSTIKQSYELEYGRNTLEIHSDAVSKGENVLIVDDLLATGGTMTAAVELVEKLGGKVETLLFVIELTFLGGRGKFAGKEILSLLSYDK
jgi:adenine phosphoribosyltransferase